MDILKEMWRDFEKWEKIGIILVISMAIAVIVISVLGVGGILPIKLTNCISIPLLGAVVLINGIILWDKDRGIASFLIGSSIFVLLGAILMIITYIASL